MFTAAEVAASREAGLEVVSVLPAGEEWLYWYPELELGADVADRRQKRLETALSAEADALGEQFPGLPISTSVVVGDATAMLSEATKRAR